MKNKETENTRGMHMAAILSATADPEMMKRFEILTNPGETLKRMEQASKIALGISQPEVLQAYRALSGSQILPNLNEAFERMNHATENISKALEVPIFR